MPADLIPHSAIPDLAAQVTPPMLGVLERVSHADFIFNSRELSEEVVRLLGQLASMGLVDPAYEPGAEHGRPHLWTRNANGSRVVRYLTGIRGGPHYQVSSTDLAAWLEDQGRWWNVAGDPLL